jgi:hypothetical protein
MADRIFATSGNWALGADNLQWIVYRKGGGRWYPVSFVRSEWTILERCMREKGCPETDREALLRGLPRKLPQSVSAGQSDVF